MWSHLPNDLLDALANTLSSAGDYFRLRLVCRGWASAFNNFFHRASNSKWPWLMLFSEKDASLLLFDMIENRQYPLQLSPTIPSCPHCFLGHKKGWIVLRPKNSLQAIMINPITCQKISLPHICDPTSCRRNEILLSDVPSTTFVAINIGSGADFVCYAQFLRSGDDRWQDLFTVPAEEKKIRTFCFLGTKLFGFANSNRLFEYDFANGLAHPRLSIITCVPHWESCMDSHTMFASPSADLFRIRKLYLENAFILMKFDFTRNMWVEAQHLLDSCVFWDSSSQSFMVSGTEELRENFVYAAGELYYPCRRLADLVTPYYMGNGGPEELKEQLSLPDIALDFPSAAKVIWFLPSLL